MNQNLFTDGNILVFIGPNNGLGGANDTTCHANPPMRGNSLDSDNESIVDVGELIGPAMRPTEKR